MDGLGGKAGWAWIFILEGAFTVLFGLASFWFVYDFPAEAKFLTEPERARVIRRLVSDNQSVGQEHFSWPILRSALLDWKMYLGALIYSGITTPLYSFSIFLPTIIQDLGWSTSVVQTQLYSVPPYVAAALLTVVVGYLADRTRTRGIYNLASSIVGVAGFVMLIASKSPGVKYGGTFLGAIGIYPCISNTITWVANNVEGSYRRGVILGFVIGWGNLNGIVSSNIYFSAPRYFEGHGVVLGFMAVFLFGGSALMMVLLNLENARRKRGERDAWVEGKDEKENRDMGDLRPDFIYTL